MMATRTLSSLRVALPFVDAISSFPSRSVSVSTMSWLTLRFRCAARAASRSFSSGGMRRRTDRPPPGGLPGRPLGSNETPKREASSPTATSLRLRPVRSTSSESRRLRSAGIRTRTSLREGASTELLAAYQASLARYREPRSLPSGSAAPELRPHGEHALADGEPGGDGENVDRPRERAPRREDEAGRDHDDALGAGADADVALEAERLGAGARVRDEERAGHGREGERERDLVALPVEDERDRAEHQRLADPVRGRVEEGAERRALPARPGEGPVEDVQDRPDHEDDGAEPEEDDVVAVLEVDEHRRDGAEQDARRRQRVRGDPRAGEAADR